MFPPLCLRPSSLLGSTGRCLIALLVTAVFGWSTCETAAGQGPLRRLGERIRERAAEANRAAEAKQQDQATLPLPPTHPPAAAAPATAFGQRRPSAAWGTQPPSFSQRSANFNRAGSPADAGRSPAEQPATGATNWQPRGGAVPLPPPPLSPLASPPPAAGAGGAGGNRQVSAEVLRSDNRARLGVVVDTPPVVQPAGLPPRRPRGALVTEVQSDSAAAVSGIQTGDLIVGLDGYLIASVRDLTDRLSEYEPGDRLRIQLTRDDRLVQSLVTLAGADGIVQVPPATPPAAAASGSIISGLGNALGGLFGGGPSSHGDPVGKGSAAGSPGTAAAGAASSAAADAAPTARLPEIIVPDGGSQATEPLEATLPEPVPAPLPAPQSD